MADIIKTDRLLLRPWSAADTAAAMAIYATDDVAHWLSPVMARVPSESVMRSVLRGWIAEDEAAIDPLGHWAVEHQEDGQLVGGIAVRRLDPVDEDLELAWQLAPTAWGNGYATEAGAALARWALKHDGVDELFSVVRPNNVRGVATAKRIGMEWVGETEKYHGLRLQVYRIQTAELLA